MEFELEPFRIGQHLGIRRRRYNIVYYVQRFPLFTEEENK